MSVLDDRAPATMPPLPAPIAERVARYRVAMVAAQPDIAESLLRRAALDLWKSAKVADTMHPPKEALNIRRSIADELTDIGVVIGQIDPDVAQQIIVEAQEPSPLEDDPLPDTELLNGHQSAPLFDDTPLPNGPDDYYPNRKTAGDDDASFSDADQPPLTIEEWLARNLPAPDFIMGNWLSTTTRGLLVGPTGLGKTNLALALALHIAAGRDFLHWRGQRPCRVLYIDGEMSRRLFRQRIEDAVSRLGERPGGFHALSHEDVERFGPLNTAAGQALIERFIAHISPDFIVFNSIMCLLAGDMKEGKSWSAVMPWVRSLTRRRVGQLWLHHTGHDESRSYGDKTKEWQLDTVMHMEAIEREDTDLCFDLEFRKARERTPATRADFQRARVALVDDQWTVEAPAIAGPTHVSPLGLRFLAALHNALAGEVVESRHECRAVSLDLWRAECVATGLLEIEPGKPIPPTARSLFSKHRRELIVANHIACDATHAWMIK